MNSIQNNIEELRLIEIRFFSQKEKCILNVSDNGCGISSEKLMEIFCCLDEQQNSFFEVSETVGLGQQIARAFCQAFNAKCYFSTKENYGTEIAFEMFQSNKGNVPFYVESKTADYLSNRFSNIYVALSKVVNINYF